MTMTKLQRLAPFILAAIVVLAVTAVSTSVTAQTIYRCEQGGQVTYTDAPCDNPLIQQIGGAPTASPPTEQTVIGGGAINAYGPWSGQAQYQIRHSGAQPDGAHFMAFTKLLIGEDGKVTGLSPENNCQILGLASPTHTPTMLNLDVTLSNCPAKQFNRRYYGTLLMNARSRTASLNVRSYQIGIGQLAAAEIRATLAR